MHSVFISIYLFCILMLGTSLSTQGIAQEVQDTAAEAQLTQLEDAQASEEVLPAVPEPNPSLILDALDLRDMDINDVLKLISSKTGLNIIAGKNVQGRVTIYLKNVEVHDALHIILEANDLAYVENRGIIQILTDADFERIYGFKFGQTTQRKIIQLKGMKASEALALLTQFKSTTGKVVADEQSNSILIEELPEKLKDMVGFIEMVDAPIETKMFELKYVQADLLALRIQEILTPKLGTIRFDAPSNKIFVKDTLPKLSEITLLVQQLDVPRLTKVFELSYAKAEDMLKTITSLLTKEIGHAEFDARANKLVVTDIAPKIQEIANVITSLDHKEQEVMIDARIIQVRLTDDFQFGVNWQAIIEKWHGMQFKNNLPSAPTAAQGQIKIGTLDSSDYGVVLRALNTSGKTRTLSNPSIAVVNNQEAKIHIGEEKPYVTTTTTQNTVGSPTVAESVTMITVGVELTVTPTIHDDGYITMKIKPEVSTADSKYTTGTGNEIPIKNTSEVNTTIRVKDGVTIVLGGLIKDTRTNTEEQIPMLGKIPLIGRAFRTEDKGLERTETIIFLTPHIITGDAPAEDKNPPLLKGDKIYTDTPLS